MAAGGIDGLLGRARHPRGMEVHQVEAHAPQARARRDDGEVGDLAVGDGGLGSGGLAVVHRQLDGLGGHGPDPLGMSERPYRLAGGEPGEPLGLLGVRAGCEQELGGQEDRGGEGHRRQGAAQLLGDQAQLQVGEAKAAVFLGDDDAEEPHVGEALPQGLVVGLRALEDRPHGGGRALVRKVAPRLGAQGLLIVGEFKVHFGFPGIGALSRPCAPSVSAQAPIHLPRASRMEEEEQSVERVYA